MSNSNTNLQTQSSNALHNAIMEAGSKDRPPMLAPVDAFRMHVKMWKAIEEVETRMDDRRLRNTTRIYKMRNDLLENQFHVTKSSSDLFQFLILQLQPEWQRTSMVTEREEMLKEKEMTNSCLISLAVKKIYNLKFIVNANQLMERMIQMMSLYDPNWKHIICHHATKFHELLQIQLKQSCTNLDDEYQMAYDTSQRLTEFNKRTRMIVETIHVNFDELPYMASDHVSSDAGPQCSTTVLEQDSLSLGPQSQENAPQVAEIVTTSNKLELLYSSMFSELLNGNYPVVSKSSAVHAANNPDKFTNKHTPHF
ncbi:hypothetical protein Tco_0409100 [Tanacetum coccineum]